MDPDLDLHTHAPRSHHLGVTDRPVETVHVPDGPLPVATQHVIELPRFGRFVALAELGCGGMGTVYRAHDEVLGRAIAIKVLHAQADAAIRERFLREAKAIGAVLHPNILAIYDARTEHGTPFLVMELASGGSLRDRLQSGPVAIDTVREIGIQISRALAAAHAAHIIHRDLKPANILCAQPGTWKLADFGIARLPDSTLTVTGQFLGSPSYAAPESLSAGEFSPASDIYGLAATLYEALTGTPPHGDHEIRSLVRKLQEDPPPVHTLRAVPGPIGDAIMRALSRDPAQRPGAEEFAQLLARSELAPEPTPPRRKDRTLAYVAIIAALVAAIMLMLAIRSRMTSVAAAQPARAKPVPVPVPVAKPRPQPKPPAPKPAPAPPPAERTQEVPTVPPADDDDFAQHMLEDMKREAQDEAKRLERKHRKRHHDDPWAPPPEDNGY